MSKVIIYGDESSVNNSDLLYMWVWVLFCEKVDRSELRKKIILMKEEFNVRTELKRRKVNYSMIEFYKKIIDLFIESNLKFYAIRIDKSSLDLKKFHNNSHDIALYKRYYFLLKDRLLNNNEYYIYLDKRTTKEKNKLSELNKFLDIEKQTQRKSFLIKNICEYKSESQIFIQLTDFLIWAICYKLNNSGVQSWAKWDIVSHLEKKLCKPIDQCSLPSDPKFNLFCISLK